MAPESDEWSGDPSMSRTGSWSSVAKSAEGGNGAPMCTTGSQFADFPTVDFRRMDGREGVTTGLQLLRGTISEVRRKCCAE